MRGQTAFALPSPEHDVLASSQGWPQPEPGRIPAQDSFFLQDNDGINLLLTSHFPARFGLPVYTINTRKALTWNAFAAAHFNANFGEDHHSRVSVGFLRYFGPEHGTTR